MLMFVKALGTTCYNRFGVTFPDDGEPIDWSDFPVVRWESLYGWENQPPVAVLDVKDDEDQVDIESRLPYGLTLAEHWDDPDEPAANPTRVVREFERSIKDAAVKEA